MTSKLLSEEIYQIEMGHTVFLKLQNQNPKSMCVYSFSKKNSSSILFVKLAQLRIKMSCLSSSPHVGF